MKRRSDYKHSRLRLLLLSSLTAFAAAVLMLPVASEARTATSSAPSMLSLLPAGTWMAAEANSAWWWKASDQVRKVPDVARALSGFEKKSGVSVDHDIMPWAGQIGFAIVTPPTKTELADNFQATPPMVVCAHIRNWPAFWRTMAKASEHDHDKKEANDTWVEQTYRGIDMHTELENGKVDLRVVIIRDWMVMGIGDKPAKLVVDAWLRHSRSMADNGSVASAMSSFTSNTAAWTFVNIGAVLKAIPDGDDDLDSRRVTKALVGVLDITDVSSMTDLGTGITFDSTRIPNTPRSRRFFVMVAKNLKPVSPLVYAHMPTETTAAIAIGNPNGWWTAVTQAVDLIATRKDRRDFRNSLKDAKQYLDYFAHFKGDAAIEAVYRQGIGLGVIGQVQSDNATSAQQAASDIAVLASDQASAITKDGALWHSSSVGRYSFSTSLAAHARGQMVEAASAPGWLGSAFGNPDVPHPGGKTMPQVLMVGNFKFLAGLRELIARNPTSAVEEIGAFDDFVAASQLTGARWYDVGSVDPNGTSHESLRIVDWNWRSSIAEMVAAVIKHQALFDNLAGDKNPIETRRSEPAAEPNRMALVATGRLAGQ